MDVPKIRYTRAGDLAIAYQTWGEGPHEVVIAGGPASHLEVHWEIPPLARFYQRIGSFATAAAFDRRGTGLSDPVEGAATLEQHMEDLAATIRAVGFERPALVAASEAGRMLLLYAATFPDRVQSLVLMGVSPYGHAVMRPEIAEHILDVIDGSWGNGDLVELFAPSLAADPEMRRLFGRLERMALSPGMARKLVALSTQTDVRSILPSVQVPVLAIHRRDDRFAPIEAAREMASALPNAKLVEIDGIDNTLWSGDVDSVTDVIEEFITGHRPRREPDRVLASVLITDICNSTERAAELGDRAWRELLDRHHRLVRQHLERHGGHEVKTLGDGFVATFGGPARAVRAARDCIDAARRELALELRAGVHTGEIELLEDDIAGVAVHIAARVAAQAQPGEVLVSRTVRDLVVGSGLDFTDRGTHRLRGVPDEWELLALSA